MSEQQRVSDTDASKDAGQRSSQTTPGGPADDRPGPDGILTCVRPHSDEEAESLENEWQTLKAEHVHHGADPDNS